MAVHLFYQHNTLANLPKLAVQALNDIGRMHLAVGIDCPDGFYKPLQSVHAEQVNVLITFFFSYSLLDGVVSTIPSLNLKDVCSVVLLMKGPITSENANQVEEAIRDASFPAIKLLRSLIFDNQLSDAEIALIIKVDSEQAKKMRNDFAKQDGDVRIYEQK